ADLTVRQVVEALVKATPERPADFSGKDLSFLDLSSLDFKGANLAGANLYGVDFTDANLSRSNLSGANLDHTTIIRTRFAGADLSRVSLFMASAFSTLEASADEAPSFAGANLSEARLVVRLAHCDMRGADFSHAHLSVDRRVQLKGPVPIELSG